MYPVVVLTQSYRYWGETPLRRALALILKGKAEIVKADESHEIHTGINASGAVFKLPAPLVVRLLEFVGIHVKSDVIKWSPEAVYERDGNICQYWHYDEKGKRYRYRCTEEEKTIDHLVPKGRGGTNIFINTVTSCRWHNITVKRGRTPREAGLELIRLPEIPKRRKGDMVVLTFKFNPGNKAHIAFQEMMRTATA